MELDCRVEDVCHLLSLDYGSVSRLVQDSVDPIVSKVILELCVNYAKVHSEIQERSRVFDDQYVVMQNERESFIAKNKILESRLKDAARLENESAGLREAVRKNCREVEEIRNKVTVLEYNKSSLESSLKIEKENNTCLNNEIARLRGMHNENMKEINNISKLLEDIRSKYLVSQVSLISVETELKQLKKQYEWTNKEYENISNLYYEEKKMVSDKIFSLTNEIEIVTNKCSSYEVFLKEKEDIICDQNTKLEEYLNTINTIKNEKIEIEATLNEDLNTKSKLCDIYKEKSDTFFNKILQLEASRDEMEIERNIEKSKWEEEISILEERSELTKTILCEKTEEIEVLKKRLYLVTSIRNHENGLENEGIEDGDNGHIHSTIPTSLVVSHEMIKNNMSISDLFYENTKLLSELESSNQEIHRLKRCLEEVYEDIKQKEPMLNSEREKYKEAMRASKVLEEDMQSTIANNMTLTSKIEEYEEKLKRYDVLEQENKDLCKQVSRLVSDISGIENDMEDKNLPAEDAELSDIIDLTLVTFGDVQTLQRKNIELLSLVRELSRRNEELENKTYKVIESETKTQLEESLDELQQIREERKREIKLVESLVSQRNMLRELIKEERKEKNIGSVSSSLDLNSDHGSLPDSEINLEGDMSKLYNEFVAYKKEKKISEEEDKTKRELLQKEVYVLKLSEAKLENMIEYLQERNTHLEKRFLSKDNEFQEMKGRFDHTIDLLSESQNKIHGLTTDLVRFGSEEQRLRSKIESIEIENRFIKENYNKSVKENQFYIEEKERTLEAMKKLHETQKNFGEENSLIRNQLIKKIEVLEQDISQMEKKYFEEVEGNRLILVQLEDERRNMVLKENSFETAKHLLELQIKEETDRFNRMNERCSKLEDSLKDANKRIDILLEVSQRNLQKYIHPASGDTNEQTSSRGEHEFSGHSMLDKYMDIQKELDRYRSRCNTLSNRHSELQKSYEELDANYSNEKKLLETKLSTSQKTNMEYQDMIDTRNSELESIRNEYDNVKKDRDEMAEKFKQKVKHDGEVLQEKEKQLELLKNDLMIYERDNKTLKDDIQIAAVARGKDIEIFNNRCVELEKTIEDLRMSISDAEHTNLKNMDIIKVYEMKSEQHANGVLKYEERIRELNEQNQILHNHLQLFDKSAVYSNHVKSYMKDHHDEHSKDDMHVNLDQHSKEMQNVIIFLQKEKDIMSLSLENKQRETERLNLNVTALTNSLTEIKSLLEIERKKTKDITGGSYDSLLDKLNQLNVLRESNMLLRQEKDNKEKVIDELKVTNTELRERTVSLTEEIGRLSAEIRVYKEEIIFLKEEVMQWRDKFNGLLEGSGKDKEHVNMGDYNKLVEENSSLKKQLDKTNEEIITQVKSIEEITSNNRMKYESIITNLEKSKETFRKENEHLTNEIKNHEKHSKECIENVNMMKSQLIECMNGKSDLMKEVEEKTQLITKYKNNMKSLKKKISMNSDENLITNDPREEISDKLNNKGPEPDSQKFVTTDTDNMGDELSKSRDKRKREDGDSEQPPDPDQTVEDIEMKRSKTEKEDDTLKPDEGSDSTSNSRVDANFDGGKNKQANDENNSQKSYHEDENGGAPDDGEDEGSFNDDAVDTDHGSEYSDDSDTTHITMNEESSDNRSIIAKDTSLPDREEESEKTQSNASSSNLKKKHKKIARITPPEFPKATNLKSQQPLGTGPLTKTASNGKSMHKIWNAQKSAFLRKTKRGG